MAQIQKLQEQFVGPGERRTFEHLRDHLPAEWFGVALKEIVVSPDYVREADFVLLGHSSIFVVEEKSWGGKIRADENWWYVGNSPRHSPLNQAEQVAKAAAGVIKRRFPALQNENLVRAVVLLSDSTVQLQLSPHEKRVDRVMRIEQATDRLQQIDERYRSPFVCVSRDVIMEYLGRLPARRIPPEVGAYKIVEALPSNGIFRNWSALHLLTNAERLLRAVSIRQCRSDEERAALLTPILREYEVYSRLLDELSQQGRVPKIGDPFLWQDDFYVFPVQPLKGLTLLVDRANRTEDENAILRFMSDAFGLLAEIHSKGIVHRNLSPDRVHIVSEGKAGFSDFLIAKVEGMRTVADSAWRTDSESPFTAPETRIAVHSASPAADVYSLAASLIFWLTGAEQNQHDMSEHVVSKTPHSDVGFVNLILNELLTCLRARPQDRPSASQMSSSFA